MKFRMLMAIQIIITSLTHDKFFKLILKFNKHSSFEINHYTLLTFRNNMAEILFHI